MGLCHFRRMLSCWEFFALPSLTATRFGDDVDKDDESSVGTSELPRREEQLILYRSIWTATQRGASGSNLQDRNLDIMDRRTTGLKNDGTPDKRTTEGKRLLAAQQTSDSIPAAFFSVLGIVFVIGLHFLLMLVELISTLLSKVCAFLSDAAQLLAYFVVLVTLCRLLWAPLGNFCVFLAAAWKGREAARIRQSMPSRKCTHKILLTIKLSLTNNNIKL